MAWLLLFFLLLVFSSFVLPSPPFFDFSISLIDVLCITSLLSGIIFCLLLTRSLTMPLLSTFVAKLETALTNDVITTRYFLYALFTLKALDIIKIFPQQFIDVWTWPLMHKHIALMAIYFLAGCATKRFSICSINDFATLWIETNHFGRIFLDDVLIVDALFFPKVLFWH